MTPAGTPIFPPPQTLDVKTEVVAEKRLEEWELRGRLSPPNLLKLQHDSRHRKN